MDDQAQLIEACRVIIASKLPADSDPLLVERHNIARDLLRELLAASQHQIAVDGAKTEAAKAEALTKFNSSKAHCDYLGDRLLQIAAASALPALVQ